MPFQPQVALLSKQMAAVELRELTEKQKAEHATIMYQNIKGKIVGRFIYLFIFFFFLIYLFIFFFLLIN